MKQQINFYARIERGASLPKATITIGALVVVIMLGYAVSAGFMFSESRALEKQIALVKSEGQTLSKQIQARQTRDQSIDIAQLETKLEDLKHLMGQQAILHKFLQDPSFTNLTGFSEALTGLARQHIQGVAIESIELTQRGRKFTMTGKVQHPNALPTYIERLGNEPPFAQMSFEKIDISEVDGQLDFRVSSLSQEEAGS